MQTAAGQALMEAISQSMGLGSNGARVDPTKILESYINTVAKSSSNNAVTLNPDQLFVINSAQHPADLVHFRNWLSAEERAGAKGLGVLHHFPIFRQFFHFHENPSSSVISGTFSHLQLWQT